MPAWITPLLCVLVSIPGRGWRSSTHTDAPVAAIARAAARPVTPPPTIATSTDVRSEADPLMRGCAPGASRRGSVRTAGPLELADPHVRICVSKRFTDVQTGDYRRTYRAGRILPRRIAALEGLRGGRHHPPFERAELLAHSASARPHHHQAGRPARSAV